MPKKSLSLFPETSKNLEGLLSQFDEHYRPATNIIFERYKFNSRTHQDVPNNSQNQSDIPIPIADYHSQDDFPNH